MITQFTGKKAVVTGSSSDLGLALIPLLLEEGLTILAGVHSSRGEEKVRTTFQNEIQQGKIQVFSMDLSRFEQLDQISWKEVSYLCDLAHPNYESLVAAADVKELENYFAATLTGRSALLKSAFRGMIRQKFGRALFLSSTAAERVFSGQGFYAASKAAAEQLYQTAGIEMASKGITTVVLRPGYIESGRGKRFSQNHSVEKRIPTGRILASREVAETIVFLLSDSALQINASVVTMDGGMNRAKATQV